MMERRGGCDAQRATLSRQLALLHAQASHEPVADQGRVALGRASIAGLPSFICGRRSNAARRRSGSLDQALEVGFVLGPGRFRDAAAARDCDHVGVAAVAVCC